MLVVSVMSTPLRDAGLAAVFHCLTGRTHQPRQLSLAALPAAPIESPNDDVYMLLYTTVAISGPHAIYGSEDE